MPGRCASVERGFDEGKNRIQYDYFGVGDEKPLYAERASETRFRMQRSVFQMVLTRLKGRGIFVRRVAGLGRPAIHHLQPLVASL